jgi:hypothetical protein
VGDLSTLLAASRPLDGAGATANIAGKTPPVASRPTDATPWLQT